VVAPGEPAEHVLERGAGRALGGVVVRAAEKVVDPAAGRTQLCERAGLHVPLDAEGVDEPDELGVGQARLEVEGGAER
jgi:hypothetical protein